MISWRTLMAALPELSAPTQYTQNPQNEGISGNFDHTEDIEQNKQFEGVALVAPIPIPEAEVPLLPVLLPAPPLTAGWLVAYRDQQGVLCGGCDDRQRGTVRECQWRMGIWTVRLTDGQQLPLTRIRSVGQTNGEGKIVAAWTVREHGYDGKGKPSTSGEAG
jgi:hypothetical protein